MINDKYYEVLCVLGHTDPGLLRILTSSNSLFFPSHRLLVQSQDPRRGRLLRCRRRSAVVIAVWDSDRVPVRGEHKTKLDSFKAYRIKLETIKIVFEINIIKLKLPKLSTKLSWLREDVLNSPRWCRGDHVDVIVVI